MVSVSRIDRSPVRSRARFRAPLSRHLIGGMRLEKHQNSSASMLFLHCSRECCIVMRMTNFCAAEVSCCTPESLSTSTRSSAADRSVGCRSSQCRIIRGQPPDPGARRGARSADLRASAEGLRLTAAGELCVEHIREVLKNYERLEGRIRGLKTPQAGKVSLVTTVGLASGRCAGNPCRFRRRASPSRSNCATMAGPPPSTPVLTGEVDLGLGFNHRRRPASRTLANFDVPVGVVFTARHRLAGEAGPIDLVEVVQEPLILAQLGTSPSQHH